MRLWGAFSTCRPGASSYQHHLGNLLKMQILEAPPQAYWIRSWGVWASLFFLTSLPGESAVHSSLRIAVPWEEQVLGHDDLKDNSWGSLCGSWTRQSLINVISVPAGVKHSVGIICIKYKAEASLLTLMATQRKIRMSYPKDAYEPLKNCQRPKPFVVRYFNTPFAYRVCLTLSFIYQSWPLSSLFYSPRPKREAKYGKERTSTTYSVPREECLPISFWSLPAHHCSTPPLWFQPTVPNLPFYILGTSCYACADGIRRIQIRNECLQIFWGD